ncbi:MAG: DEAD/DEAH box helicase, partial [Anaerolineaceae bacterium]|nr:DEAD/DEAH box helicase [Anaerolineaceae bacterium]
MVEFFNPFSTLSEVQSDYLAYVESFQQIKNPQIREWIEGRRAAGGLLWKPPYVQISLPFQEGDPLAKLVEEKILLPGTLRFARQAKEQPESPPIRPYVHQTTAIRKIHAGKNVILATGTGSGKSFGFGLPIVSTALRLKAEGVRGVKAVIVYPMNALANNQYDDFSERLDQSGLTIGRYTGDTKNNPDEALSEYQRLTGRDAPYECEVLSRKEIQDNPPDILMTNYVMLELLLTRFEDRTLFRHQGVLQFLVLDEVHTYSGKRGADVAALIRRLKQHTGTIGKLTCIGTSATVESGEGESAQEAVAK